MFYSITLGYSLFAVLLPLSRFSLGVFVFTSRVLKRTQKRKRKKRSMFSIEERFSELPACRMQFLDPFCLSSRPINVGVDICESVSSESSHLTYTQRPHISSVTLYRARAKFQDNRIVCLPTRHNDRIINPLRIELRI